MPDPHEHAPQGHSEACVFVHPFTCGLVGMGSYAGPQAQMRGSGGAQGTTCTDQAGQAGSWAPPACQPGSNWRRGCRPLPPGSLSGDHRRRSQVSEAFLAVRPGRAVGGREGEAAYPLHDAVLVL